MKKTFIKTFAAVMAAGTIMSSAAAPALAAEPATVSAATCDPDSDLFLCDDLEADKFLQKNTVYVMETAAPEGSPCKYERRLVRVLGKAPAVLFGAYYVHIQDYRTNEEETIYSLGVTFYKATYTTKIGDFHSTVGYF
ncbi:MAG: hypothetical protein HUJ54_04055 [Erysipelotrichaceae bacterium]|nr:hypothetical protein [Erysipelotrichaceae bacterium]